MTDESWRATLETADDGWGLARAGGRACLCPPRHRRAWPGDPHRQVPCGWGSAGRGPRMTDEGWRATLEARGW